MPDEQFAIMGISTKVNHVTLMTSECDASYQILLSPESPVDVSTHGLSHLGSIFLQQVGTVPVITVHH